MKEKLKKKPASKRLTLYHSTDQERYMLKKKKKKERKMPAKGSGKCKRLTGIRFHFFV